MIYNLYEYLRLQLTTQVFIVNGWLQDSPEESATLIDNGGTDEPWYTRKEFAIQVLARSSSRTKARKNIYEIFNLLRRRFGLVLPAVTIDGELFPAVTTYQISPNQIPGSLGSDDRSLEMWSVNFRIITK